MRYEAEARRQRLRGKQQIELAAGQRPDRPTARLTDEAQRCRLHTVALFDRQARER